MNRGLNKCANTLFQGMDLLLGQLKLVQSFHYVKKWNGLK